MTALDEAMKILLEVAHIASPKELPKNFSENCTAVWKVFKLGQQHERLKLNDRQTIPT